MTTFKAVAMLILAVFILSVGTACREKPNKYRRFERRGTKDDSPRGMMMGAHSGILTV